MDEQAHYIRRINQQNEEYRQRNGELYTALQTADPEAADALTPVSGSDTHNIDSRYTKIDKIITACGTFYANDHNGDSNALGYLGDDIRRLYRELHDYWIDTAAERQRRTEQADKRIATRRANQATKEAHLGTSA